jgi:phosphocarrier protein FPr
MEILEAIQKVQSPAGVLVLMDMGSAVLSAETALGFLDDELRAKVHLCAAPFVEGAVAAGVIAHAGSDLATVEREARQSLSQKRVHLGDGEPSAPEPVAKPPAGPEQEVVVPVRNPHGIHARPAAKLVKEAARFQAEIRAFNATTGKGPASARSLSGLGALEVGQGQEIRFAASGPDAAKALKVIGDLVMSGFGEGVEEASAPQASPEPATTQGSGPLPLVEGIAIGPAYVAEAEISVPNLPASAPEVEREKLRQALAMARTTLEADAKQAHSHFGEEKAGIFDAQAVLLDDPALRDEADQLIAEGKVSAANAWARSVKKLCSQYEELHDVYLRQRAADVRDVGRRVLERLGVAVEAIVPDKPAILIVDDLTPGQAAELRGSAVVGVVCLDGGRTSHGAILLRALGIPAVFQARSIAAGVRDGVTVALDGTTGNLWIDPAPPLRAELEASREAWGEARANELAQAAQPAVTEDGHRIVVEANAGGIDDVRAARRSGAEGIGLLRTEFLFLDRTAPPDEEEQYAALRPLVEAFGDGPIVVRTLDAGGDKNLPYLALPREANPFLGVRALRISLRQPELFSVQLRAILRAGEGKNVHIMFPMVAEPDELDRALALLQQAHETLESEKKPHLWPVHAGIMVEVPSAAMMADALAQKADFFSIGTNDLTQYALAADRGNPALGHFQDALHPGVLALVARVTEAAARHGKRVAVCGEAAGDPVAARILVGLGVGELSVAPKAVPQVKAVLRAARLADLQALARTALTLNDAAAVRALIQ